jgi:hypothetical protein
MTPEIKHSPASWVGEVADNEDPKKLGRVRVRVLDVFDGIADDSLPWAAPYKDLNGNQFVVPDKGKVVTVYFDNGNIYTPIYIYAQHYNTNLQQKLNDVSGADYTSMRALIFDHKTQMYSNDADGLMMDYKFNQINIINSAINLNLKDGSSHVNIGTNDANQKAILGNNYMDWMDDFIDNLLGSNAGPYLGNMGAPVIPNPAMIDICLRYKALRDTKFLSWNVNIVDNGYINQVSRIADGQIGDKWKSTTKPNDLVTKEPITYMPKKGLGTENPNTADGGSLSTGDGDKVGKDGSLGAIDNQQVTPPVADVNPDAKSIIDVMKHKNYVINNRAFEVNIVGVRYQYPGQEYSNAFKDKMYVFYTDDTGYINIKSWSISTIPGKYMKGTQTQKQWAAANRPKGVGIMVPSQYLNIYQLVEPNPQDVGKNKMRGSPIMQSIGNQLAYRDKHFDDTIIHYDNMDNLDKGNHGMFIHRAFAGGTFVNNWSEGCQVFARESDLNAFFALCRTHQQKYGNKFNYTLITSKDVQDAEARLKQSASSNDGSAGYSGSTGATSSMAT